MDRLGDELRRELARFGEPGGLGEIVERWPAAVGDAIAANAWPARIGRDGTLHVATADSVWSFELAQRAAEIAARVGVRRVRFQPGPLPPSAAVNAPAPTPDPTPADRLRAARIAAPIGDENLRQTVQKAVSLGLARSAEDRRV